MSNKESIASVPVQIQDAQSLRTFLLRLVEQLDIVLGYRGDFSIVSAEAIFGDKGLQEQVTELQKKVACLNNRSFDGRPVEFDPTEVPTISASYEQAEIEQLSTAVQELQTTMTALLTELRSVEIISPS